MNVNLKTWIGSAVMLAAGTLAAQTIEMNKLTDWQKNPSIIEKNGVLTATKQVLFVSAKTFDVDPNKTYTIKLSAKETNTKEKSWILFGFIVMDSKGSSISPPNVNVVAGTQTVLVDAAKKGAKSILVKDASKWKPVAYYYVCPNAKADYSDLPNRTFLGTGITKIEKKANGWEVFLKTPVAADYAAGTPVRVHAGGGYLYTGGSANLDDNWKTLSGTIKGMSKFGWSNNIWPVTTAKAKLIILANWNNKKVEEQFKDISITIK